MPSPFPGIDPFLEVPAFWSDFPAPFINYWREAIADALPTNYEAGLGERVYLIEHEPDSRKLVFPDAAVTRVDEPHLAVGERGKVEVADMPTIGKTTVFRNNRMALFGPDGMEELSAEEWFARMRIED